jgi:hypothetical protein
MEMIMEILFVLKLEKLFSVVKFFGWLSRMVSKAFAKF